MLAFSAGEAAAQTEFTQLTDSGLPIRCGSFEASANEDGTVIAFESICQFGEQNLDQGREIFRIVDGQEPVEVTDSPTASCSSSGASTSDSGNRIAFVSDCNLTGLNLDGNIEIFLWDKARSNQIGKVVQLTNSLDCLNFAPGISGDGEFVAFDSDCNLTGDGNVDLSTEIHQISADTEPVLRPVRQLTTDDTGFCASTDVSSNEDGSLIAFGSDCDFGTNEDFAFEIFTVTNDPVPVVTQATASGDDTCASIFPSMSSDGSKIAFESDCDFEGKNGDASEEVFLVDGVGTVTQLSDDDGTTGCASALPAISAAGDAVAYSSACDPTGDNFDLSSEVFRFGPGQGRVGLTAGFGGCASFATDIFGSGPEMVTVLDSDCDHVGNNGEGANEIFFRELVCVCGAPLSDKIQPLASDALNILRRSIDSVSEEMCPDCACDTNGDGKVLAGDALGSLQASVGIDALNCAGL